MKKIFILLLCVSIVFSFSSCSANRNNASAQKNRAEIPQKEGASQPLPKPVQPQQANPFDQSAKFDPIVVMDQDGIKVTLTGFSQSTATEDGFLQLQAENNTDQDIYIQACNVVLNGYMHDPRMNIDIAAGKKANGKMVFNAEDLVLCGIQVIGDIEFYLHCITQDFNPVCDSEPFYYQTPDHENASSPYQPQEEELYNENGIQVVAEGITAVDQYGQCAFFYIKNDSGSDITVQARDVSINGFMVDPYFSVDVAAGAIAIDYMRIPAEQLSENSINRTDTMELKLRFIDNENWYNSYTTEAFCFQYTYKQ